MSGRRSKAWWKRAKSVPAKAIGQVESRSCGEIDCVVTRASDSYFYPAFCRPFDSGSGVDRTLSMGGHRARHPRHRTACRVGRRSSRTEGLPGWRVRFVPRGLRYRRAHGEARRHLRAHSIHVTKERIGVLIFVSMAEHYAQVMADTGMDARVAWWNETAAKLTNPAACGALAEGFAEAVEIIGAGLAAHFPAGAENPDEPSNHLAEI